MVATPGLDSHREVSELLDDVGDEHIDEMVKRVNVVAHQAIGRHIVLDKRLEGFGKLHL